MFSKHLEPVFTKCLSHCHHAICTTYFFFFFFFFLGLSCSGSCEVADFFGVDEEALVEAGVVMDGAGTSMPLSPPSPSSSMSNPTSLASPENTYQHYFSTHNYFTMLPMGRPGDSDI